MRNGRLVSSTTTRTIPGSGFTERNSADACQLPSAEASHAHLTGRFAAATRSDSLPLHTRAERHSTLSAPSSCVGDGPSPRRCSAPVATRMWGSVLRPIGFGKLVTVVLALPSSGSAVATRPRPRARRPARTLRHGSGSAQRATWTSRSTAGRPRFRTAPSCSCFRTRSRASGRASQALPRATRPRGRPVAVRRRSAPCAGRR